MMTVCYIHWKEEYQGHILVTDYMVKYRKSSTGPQFKKRVDRNNHSLFLRGSRKGKPYDIEVLPCCGEHVEGPSAMAEVKNCEADAVPEIPMREKIASLTDGTLVGTDPEAGTIIFGSGNTSHVVEFQEWSPGGVATTTDGKILVTDMENDSIRLIDQQGKTLEQYQSGKDGEPFQCPWDVATDEDDNIYVLDNLSVQMLDRNGKFQKQVLSDLPGNISGFAARDGRLAITDMVTKTCNVYTTDGDQILTLPTGDKVLYKPGGVAMDDNGNIYLVDDNRIIRKFDRNGDALGSMTAHNNQGGFNPGSILWAQDRGLVASDVRRDVIWGIAADDVEACSSPVQDSAKIISV